jgi:predicted TIM-barrel fold metal-dependent hydrolase
MGKILDNWKNGAGFPDTLVIDGHIHIGQWPHAATFNGVDEAVNESKAYLDANGVDAFCAVSGGYNIGPGLDYRLGNDFLIEVWKRLKDRMVPFLGMNPNDSRKNIIAELERMYKSGVRCIKLINSYQENYPGDGPNLMALYEFANAHRMLVFNHAWRADEILKIAKQFPETDFIFAHYGSWLGIQDEVMKKRENVYTNMWSLGEMGWLERGIKKAGAHKFMMGSDGFLNSLSVGIGPVVFASISDDDKRKILGLNAARLLDKVGALPVDIKKKYKSFTDN